MINQWKEYIELTTDVLNKVNNIEMDLWRKKNMPVVNSLLKPDCFYKRQRYWCYGSKIQCNY